MAAESRVALRQRLRRLVGMDTHVQLANHVAWIPNLPEALDGLKIGHLSDPHVGLVTPDVRIRNAVARLREARVDLAVLTGDFASRREGPVARIGKLLAGLECPTYFVLGNHDHNVDPVGVATQLESAGYHHLQNRSVVEHLRGEAISLIGIDDPVTGQHDIERAIAALEPTRPRLLLSHLGEALDAIHRASIDVDVCFSGHTHGGQLYVAPFTDSVMRRVVGIDHLRGLRRFRNQGPWLHVTSGVGSAVNPIRFGAAPEVAVVTLHRDRRHAIFGRAGL